MTSPGRACLSTRRWTSNRPARSVRSSSASAPTERSARTRTRSRSWGPRSTRTPRATSSTTRRSRARRPCRTCASARDRSGRPTSCTQASFVGCHQFGLLDQVDVLGRAAPGATLLLNCPHAPDEVWDALPRPVQEQILAKRVEVYAIDASRIARDVGLAGRINVVLQTCFFAISGVLPRDEAIAKIKDSIEKTYGRRGAEVVERNLAAVDRTLEGLHRIEVPELVTSTRELPPPVPAHASEFVRTVTAEMMAGRGDDLPVSALPVDGTYPMGTTAYEKRNISELVADWDSDAVHPVRQLQLRLPAHRDPLQVLRPVRAWRARRKGSGRLRWRPPGSRTPVTRCRSTSRTARAVGCASRPARSWRRATRSARRSILPNASRWSPPSATTSRSSRRSRRPTGPGWTSARCAAPSTWSRCSSSPLRVRAAARRRTSR